MRGGLVVSLLMVYQFLWRRKSIATRSLWRCGLGKGSGRAQNRLVGWLVGWLRGELRGELRG
jgi:hypothetical protein